MLTCKSLFFLFLENYHLPMIGNFGWVAFLIIDELHKPMSCFHCIIILECLLLYYCHPKMLVSFLTKDEILPFLSCTTQMLLFVSLETTECFLLVAVAYDYYVAIYNCSLILQA